MAKFRAGQKVRVTGWPHKGSEGVIARAGNTFDWIVRIEGTYLRPDLAPHLMPDEWPYFSHDLAPLTDPREDEAFQRFMDTLLRTDTPLVMYARALDMAGVK